jgi:DNA-binding CsgD family transcriptional regulator
MVAEALVSALSSIPGIVSAGFGSSAPDAEELAKRADALALAAGVPGAERSANRIRARGVRVVVVGERGPDEEGVRVPTAAPLAMLAKALVPPLAERPPTPSRLTKREEEILDLVAGGLAGKQVARQLGISPKTVEQHKTHIFAKLGVPNQTAAVFLVLGGGMGNGFHDGQRNGLTNGNGNKRWTQPST